MPSPLGTLALRWLDKLVLQGARVHLDEQTQYSLSCRIPTIRRAEAPHLKNGQHHRITGRRADRPSIDYGPAHKRPRPMSPVRDRDRERWDAPGRRRAGSPGWDRDRDRDGPPPPRRMEREREEEKGVVLPPVISWFVGQLPGPSAFDGPVFRTDDLMMVFRNAVIPSSTRPRSPPPGPPRGGGRPPPDYGPYQGPGGGRGGRRY